jgi:hypothetical protein
MKICARFIAGIAALLLAATAVAAPADRSAEPKNAAVKSAKTASVVIASTGEGETVGSYVASAGGALIPMGRRTKGSPIDANSQEEFAQALRHELLRSGIVKTAPAEASEPADVLVSVNIERATMSSDIVELKLDITLSITGGAQPFQRQYKIVSTEGDSTWAKMTTNGRKALAKVSTLMVRRLVPDIEAYVLTIPSE